MNRFILSRFPRLDTLPESHPLPLCRMTRAAAVAALTGVLVPAPGHAADIQPHAITYQISVEKPPADTIVDGQISVTLSKTCEAWNLSSAVYYGIERNAKKGQPLSDKADSYQERLTSSEKLDGTSLQYTGRYHVNGRGEDVRGTVALGADGAGMLDVKSERLPRKVKLPAETRLPVALRAKLIAGLPRSDDKARPTINVRTVEVVRFHEALDLSWTLAAPLPPLKPATPPVKGEAPPPTPPLLKGRSWTLKQTSKAFADWMESTFELHESGVISRFTFKREGIVWRADVRELSAFTSPKCD